MKTGNETWKWGLVFVLLAAFIITANQAYVHVTSQEDYPPPDDYLKGDSWDMEHESGPGAGQPMQMPDNTIDTDPSLSADQSPTLPTSEPEPQPELEHKDDIDWNQVNDVNEE
jgi:hypothetical protein